MPSGNYTGHVMITMDHISFDKQIIADYLLKHGAMGVMVVREYHGGTIEKMESRVSDPEDDLTDETKYHMHATAYGSFNKKHLTNRGRIWAKKTFNRPKVHWSVQYCHENKTKSGKTSYSPFPFPEMVNYLSDPAKDKDVDETPMIYINGHGEGETLTTDCLLEMYYNSPDTFSQLRMLKRSGGDLADFSVVMEQKLSKESASHEWNMFFTYFKNVDVTEIPLLVPTDLVLYPWQETIVQWAMTPRVRDAPNGVWMNLPSGSGKTVILESLFDNLGHDQVYIPGIRPNGSYDAASMISYNNEPLILLDEVEGTWMDDKVLWKRAFLELLKKITERFPIVTFFGGKTTKIFPNAKVLITSNFPRPHQDPNGTGCPFARRYMYIDSKDPNLLKSGTP